MVDFHSHILPGMDDGAQTVEESLQMLRSSSIQGVTAICATPHFHADDEDPMEFFHRRHEAVLELARAMQEHPGNYPRILLGAEIAYFPGMGESNELKVLAIGKTPCLLIEPPMDEWQDYVLDEIEEVGRRLRMYPILAHVDRYMRFLGDDFLPERLADRKVLMQFNASFFYREDSRPGALDLLNRGRIHLVGSDCHNTYDRPPRLGEARQAMIRSGGGEAWKKMEDRAEKNILRLAKQND